MATIEKSGFLKYKDAAGNTYLVLPITTKDNVDGIDEIEAAIEALQNLVGTTAVSTQISDAVSTATSEMVNFGKAQTLTAVEKSQARENIGVNNPKVIASDDGSGNVTLSFSY